VGSLAGLLFGLGVFLVWRSFEPPAPHLSLIGHSPDQIMPMHYYYDLERPLRDDALVWAGPVGSGGLQPSFETLRESLAWEVAFRSRFRTDRARFQGTLTFDDDNVTEALDATMTNRPATRAARSSTRSMCSTRPPNAAAAGPVSTPPVGSGSISATMIATGLLEVAPATIGRARAASSSSVDSTWTCGRECCTIPEP